MNVTRSQLVSAAEQTLQIAQAHLGHPVSPILAEEVRETARQATKIGYSWTIDGCGCLVGAARMRYGYSAEPGGPSLASEHEEEIVGRAFYLPFKDLGGGASRHSILNVIEDPVTEPTHDRELVLA